MAKKQAKTNAMRILDKLKVDYIVREYPSDGSLNAVDVADYFEQPPEKVFKTLVTTDNKGGYYVFCIPSNGELDLKKGAVVSGTKKIEMLKQKDLLGLTGYIHGGCSPVGMKKAFPTYMDLSGQDWDTIYVSGGRIGLQIELNPRDLEKILDFSFEDVQK